MGRRNPRVAVIDDDPSVCIALGRLLRALDMVPDIYSSAIAFLDALQTEPPDCLVLDLQMPGMNGLEVMNYLSRRNIRIPTIVITAHAELAEEQTCVSAGAVAFLRKPFDAQALRGAIAGALA